MTNLTMNNLNDLNDFINNNNLINNNDLINNNLIINNLNNKNIINNNLNNNNPINKNSSKTQTTTTKFNWEIIKKHNKIKHISTAFGSISNKFQAVLYLKGLFLFYRFLYDFI